MLRDYKEGTVCIRIRIGDKIQYEDGRIGTLKCIDLVPNAANEPNLIALLTVKFLRSEVEATANHFIPVNGEMYLY